MSDFETLRDAINAEWMKRYGGDAVEHTPALVNRVRQLAADRDCWVTTARAIEKDRTLLAEKLAGFGVR